MYENNENTHDHGNVCTAHGTTVNIVATRFSQLGLSQKPAFPSSDYRQCRLGVIIVVVVVTAVFINYIYKVYSAYLLTNLLILSLIVRFVNASTAIPARQF